MKFAIYYATGDIYKGDTKVIADVSNAPTWDVITVKHQAENPQGFSLRHGCDFYGWAKLKQSNGEWTSGEWYWSGLGDLFGLANYFRDTQYEMQKVLIGREIPDATFKEIIQKAIDDGCLCKGDCEHRG